MKDFFSSVFHSWRSYEESNRKFVESAEQLTGKQILLLRQCFYNSRLKCFSIKNDQVKSAKQLSSFGLVEHKKHQDYHMGLKHHVRLTRSGRAFCKKFFRNEDYQGED